MAIDRYLFQQHAQGHLPPTLRFYSWSPIAISLGYHQRTYPDHWRTGTWQGQPIDLIPRPTGGRAVLHQGDLTYAVIASGFSAKRLESYQQICEVLIQGWRSLGVELIYGQAGRGYIHNPNCFGTATGADLVLSDGSKLIGSAQARQGSTILQHGSMRLQPDRALFEHIFGTTDLQFPILTPEQQDHQRIQTAIVNAAINLWNIEFTIEPLSESEWEQIRRESHPVNP